MPDLPDAVVSSSALSGSAVTVITSDRQVEGTQNVQICTFTANRAQTVKVSIGRFARVKRAEGCNEA